MKGYISNGICYIFPQEVAQIPEVEADFYYVQQEDYAAWVTANESLADKIVKYNFNILAAKAKPFAGHTDDNLEPTQKEDPELAWSAESATAQIGETNTFPTLTNPHSVTVSYSSSDNTKASIDATTGEVTLVAEGNATISAVFAGDDTYEAQTVTYTLTVQAVQPILYDIVYGGDYSSIITNTNISSAAEGQVLVFAAQSGIDLYNDYTIRVDDILSAPIPVDAPTATNNTLTFTMPDKNAYITITAVQHTYTFEIDDTGTLINVGSYEEGDSVQYTFDHALQQEELGMWHYEYTMSPASLDNYNFSPGIPSYLEESDPEHPVEVPEVPAEISFIMPASDVLFTITQVNEEVL